MNTLYVNVTSLVFNSMTNMYDYTFDVYANGLGFSGGLTGSLDLSGSASVLDFKVQVGSQAVVAVGASFDSTVNIFGLLGADELVYSPSLVPA